MVTKNAVFMRSVAFRKRLKELLLRGEKYMKNLALIPARSGSKGLPNKNIKELNGFPLMGYTIKAAIESCCFDEIMVSTDSLQYAEIAKNLAPMCHF